MDPLEQRLRNLIRKWISMANHPQRSNDPVGRALLLRCAEQLRTELDNEHRGHLRE